MQHTGIENSITVLRGELERGEDICDAPVLIHQVAQSLGGQTLLCGDPAQVERFLAFLPPNTEPALVFEWLRISMVYANDGGAGLRSLAASWASSLNQYKAYIAHHLEEFAWS